MLAFHDIKPGSRLRGLDAAGIAEVVQVSRFGADALDLVFRVHGRRASITASFRPQESCRVSGYFPLVSRRRGV